MIRYVKADLFTLPATIQVNTVNCVGVMGAGVAKQFRFRYPHNYEIYQRACKHHILKPGRIIRVRESDLAIEIWNAATKDHWRDPSKLSWVHDIIDTMAFSLHPDDVVVMPRLGCGLGGLHWPTVRDLIETYLSDYDVTVASL